MQIKPDPDLPPPPSKPQLHTRKNHDSYLGARSMPTSIHIRGPFMLPVSPPGEPFIAAPTTAPPGVVGVDGDGDGDGSPTSLLLSPVPVYEVMLLYRHNRACTILRAEDDFLSLRRGLASWRPRPGEEPILAPSCLECWAVEGDPDSLAKDHLDHRHQQPQEEQEEQEEAKRMEGGCESAALDVRILDRFLREVIKKQPDSCAAEYFLKRRAGDCGGR